MSNSQNQKSASPLELVYAELSKSSADIEHLELQQADFGDLSQVHSRPLVKTAAATGAGKKQYRPAGFAFEDEAVKLLAPIHSVSKLRETRRKEYGAADMLYLLEGGIDHSEAYLELSSSAVDGSGEGEHLELVQNFDPFSLASSSQGVKRSALVLAAGDRSASGTSKESEFASSLILKPVVQHSQAPYAATEQQSFLPLLGEYNVQAQAYAEMSSNAAKENKQEHLELIAFDLEVEKKSAFDGMRPSQAVEVLRFKRFFNSLIKEIKADPDMSLAQISARVGLLINPLTGKPAGKDFFLRLFKEARRLSFRALKRSSSPNTYGYGVGTSALERDLMKAVSNIISASSSEESQFSSPTDSLLPEVLFFLKMPFFTLIFCLLASCRL